MKQEIVGYYTEDTGTSRCFYMKCTEEQDLYDKNTLKPLTIEKMKQDNRYECDHCCEPIV